MDIINELQKLITMAECVEYFSTDSRYPDRKREEEWRIKRNLQKEKIIEYIEKLEAQSYDGLGDDL